MRLFIPTHILTHEDTGEIEPLVAVERAGSDSRIKVALLTYDEWNSIPNLKSFADEDFWWRTKYELGKDVLLTRKPHSVRDNGDCSSFCESCAHENNYIRVKNITLCKSFNSGGTRVI